MRGLSKCFEAVPHSSENFLAKLSIHQSLCHAGREKSIRKLLSDLLNVMMKNTFKLPALRRKLMQKSYTHYKNNTRLNIAALIKSVCVSIAHAAPLKSRARERVL